MAYDLLILDDRAALRRTILQGTTTAAAGTDAADTAAVRAAAPTPDPLPRDVVLLDVPTADVKRLDFVGPDPRTVAPPPLVVDVTATGDEEIIAATLAAAYRRPH